MPLRRGRFKNSRDVFSTKVKLNLQNLNLGNTNLEQISDNLFFFLKNWIFLCFYGKAFLTKFLKNFLNSRSILQKGFGAIFSIPVHIRCKCNFLVINTRAIHCIIIIIRGQRMYPERGCISIRYVRDRLANK